MAKLIDTTVYGDLVTTLTISAGTVLYVPNGTGINEFSIDGTLAGNSDNALPTEKAVKTYVDAVETTSNSISAASREQDNRLNETLRDYVDSQAGGGGGTGFSNKIVEGDSGVVVNDAGTGSITISADGSTIATFKSGNVGIGTTEPTSLIHLETTPGEPDGVVQKAIYLDINPSGSHSSAHHIYGISLDVDSTVTENEFNSTLRGLDVNVYSKGDVGSIYGTQTLVYHSSETSAAAGHVYANYNQASIFKGSSTWLVGGRNTAYISSKGYGSNAYGSYNTVQMDSEGKTLGTAYGVYSNVNRTNGTLSVGYLFYGQHSGTVGTPWGVYITGENKNYFSGDVGIGEQTPGAKLDVNGDLILLKGVVIDEFSNDTTLEGNSPSATPTEYAVKTYSDNISAASKEQDRRLDETLRDYVDTELTGVVLADGTIPLTANWNIGNHKIGINIASPLHPLHIFNNPGTSSNSYGIYLDIDPSGTLSGDITHKGLYININSSIKRDGNSYYLVGGDFGVISSSDADVTEITGLSVNAQHNVSSTLNNYYGLRLQGQFQNGQVNNAYGNYSSVMFSTGSSATAFHSNYSIVSMNSPAPSIVSSVFGYRSMINQYSGEITNGYLFYGSYNAGTVGTKWGIYLSGETKNYISGKVAIGLSDPSVRQVEILGPGVGIWEAVDNGIVIETKATYAEIALWKGSWLYPLQVSDSSVNLGTLTGWAGVCNLLVAGNITQNDGLYIATDEVRARDSGGLNLKDDSGTLGLSIADGGALTTGNHLTFPNNKGLWIKDTGASSRQGVLLNSSNAYIFGDTAISQSYYRSADQHIFQTWTGGVTTRMLIGQALGIQFYDNTLISTGNNLTLGGVAVSGFSTVSTISDRTTAVPTEKAVKDYVDNISVTGEAGTVALGNGVSTKTVTFSTAANDSTYPINVSLSNKIDANPSIYGITVSGKTTAGFTVTFSGVMDSANYVLEWSVNQKDVPSSSAYNTMPTGAISSWVTSAAPDGWLECDGSAVSRTSYDSLFDVIGEQFGNGDGSTTFNLPDLRGEFLRGWDHGAGNDPDAESRDNRGDAVRGDNVGTSQDDELESHLHTINSFTGSVNANTGTGASYHRVNVYVDKPTSSTGGNETRPRNVYVMWIIKYTTPALGLTTDHGDLIGLGDDDHTQYSLVDGTRGGGYNSRCHGYADVINQTIGDADWAKVVLGAEEYDDLNEFDDVTNSRFTATAAGYYHVIGQVSSSEVTIDGERHIVRIYKNGSATVLSTDLTAGAASYTSEQVSGILKLAATDYLELWFYHTHGGVFDIVNISGDTFMMVHRIS